MKILISLFICLALPSFGVVIDGVKFDPTQDTVDSLLTKTNSWSNPPIYLADGITTKKVGTTFSVADWIPQNLVDVYSQMLVHYGATSRGMLDGPGYLFNDQNGILTALSANYTFQTRWYHNQGSTNIPSTNGVVTPITQWKMNDNAGNTVVVDSVGTNNGVATANTSTLSFAGKVNTALSFDGTTEVKYNSSPDFNLPSAFTISLWIYFNNVNGGRVMANHQDAYAWGTVGTWGWLISGPYGINFAYVPTAGGVTEFSFSSGSINASQWYHFAITRDGSGKFIVYKDGNQIYTNTVTQSFSSGQPLFLGTLGGHGENFNGGRLDDIRIYHAALSSNQIVELVQTPSESTQNVTIVSLTNSMSLACTNKVVDFLPASTWLSILASGTGLTTNDVQGYVSPDYGTNWYQASLVPSASIDLSNTLFQGVATYTNNVSSSNMVLKAVTTSNKVVKILGMWGPSN